MIKITQGDILSANTDAIVNTVNCVGVMGKGLALQFKKAYPDNYRVYKLACDHNEIQTGKMFTFMRTSQSNPKYIINFPTKQHWRDPSEIEFIDTGLEDLVRVIPHLSIKSIAIPPLGCGLGGLEWSVVLPKIKKAMMNLNDVDILIYEPGVQVI